MNTDYDVAVVGAGPAGISAALTAASEGMSAVMLYAKRGGRSSTTSLIENYLGFPNGISGPEFARLGLEQALKFGASQIQCSVNLIEKVDGLFKIGTSEGQVTAKAIVAATGADYIHLDAVDKLNRVHYEVCAEECAVKQDLGEVAIIGGGNSAGQAAMFLSEFAERVHVLVRKDGLQSSMSSYLRYRIQTNPKIVFHRFTEVEAAFQSGLTTELRLKRLDTDARNRLNVSDVYVLIGAKPLSHLWTGLAEVDDKGYVMTDESRQTATEGLFAAGDIRSGSVKRIINAAGEGASVIPFIERLISRS